MGESLVSQDEITGWLQAIEVVEGRYVWRRLVKFLLIVTVTLVTFTWKFLCDGYSWWWGVLLTVCLALGWFLIDCLSARDARGKVREKLRQDTELARQIVAGEVTGNELHEESPWPVSVLLRSISDPTPEQTITRVAMALDWYRDPAKRYIPVKWVISIVALVVAIFLVRGEVADSLDKISRLGPFLYIMLTIAITDSFVIGSDRFEHLAEGFRRCADPQANTVD